ncbi:MAG TPA: glycosyltransferase family 2 protein [Anaerolineales bacterium]|nr:glycosyltransferase family 2 protein [Anaerolineales bacterium]
MPESLPTSDTKPVDMSIVLVCWNNKDYLDPCLKSLYDANLENSFDVVVVDNGSNDGSQAMLREKYPQVQLIQNDHNVGLGKASNQGIEATNGEFILLLNNDTIVNKHALDSLANFMRTHPDAGAVGGKLLNADLSFQSGYGGFSTLMEEFLIAIRVGELSSPGYPLHGDSDAPCEVGWMSSANLLVRRKTLDEIGLLDESYFIYGDETDIQYRMHKAGWKAYYLPDATTIHYGGRSMNRWKRRRMVYRGKMLFYKKNYGAFRTFVLQAMLFGLSFLKLLVWAFLWVIPGKRERAQLELNSNLDVLKVCLKLE